MGGVGGLRKIWYRSMNLSHSNMGQTEKNPSHQIDLTRNGVYPTLWWLIIIFPIKAAIN